ELYKAERIRSIGVSNFYAHHLEALMQSAEVMPMVNQIEFHPGFMQREVVDFCRQHDILVEAWSPLGTGKMLSNETLLSVADKYGRSVAQLCVLWKVKALKVINAVLAVLIGLFNIAHAFMELPSDNAGQYVIMPMMIIVGIVLAWYSIKYVRED
ncbi:MAG: aldo/keto reductase, partial [Prevotella sp.]|nr:aldo/keto reductase [Prevotella sp.]